MSKKILAIATDAVHKICSGQVVLNLATAIKELVENSLDAKASTVEIRLKEYGSELIEISDNGTGIHPDNFEALALKHHTSKIEDFNDLVDVETFGFRGEALSSLCAVGQLVVVTRHESQACGSKLKFNYMGVLQEIQPCPRQVGTTVTLTNLFSSLPVRQREFHRNLKKEFGKATQLLSAYCLTAKDVKVTCVNQTKKGGRTTFLSTQNNKTVRENISCIFGSKQLVNLVDIIHADPDEEILEEFSLRNEHVQNIKIEGYISSCEHGCGRSSTDRQFFYINSRPCEPAKVMRLTNEVYHRYNQHQSPFVFLNMTMPKQLVDVNVTPDKRLIFLQNEKSLLAIIKSSLIKTFENIPSTYRLNTAFPIEKKSVQRKTEALSTLSILNKWKHPNDKTITLSANDRKRGIEEYSENTTCKQIRLDCIFKKSENYSNNFKNCIVDVNITPQESNTVAVSEANIEYLEKNVDDAVNFKSICYNKSEIKDDNAVNFEPVSCNASKTEEEVIFRINSEEINNETNFQEEQNNSTEVCTETKISIREGQGISVQEENCLTSCILSPKASTYSENLQYTFDSAITSNKITESAKRSSEPNVIIDMYDDTQPIRTHELRKFRSMDTSIESIQKSLLAKRKCKRMKQLIINKFHAEIDPEKNQLAEEELKKEISKEMFAKMKIIGQFNLGFILTKLGNDLFIIDQHATDEKYNFETLQRNTSLTGQKLVVPQDLDLTVMNECILMDSIDVFRKNGFEFSIDETAEATKKVKLVSIPVSYNWQFGKEDIDEMLFMLQDAPNTLCRPTRIRSMFASRACRKSVMIGTHLTTSDMKKIVNNMGLIEQPWNCPHGRPTMRHLVNLSLLK